MLVKILAILALVEIAVGFIHLFMMNWDMMGWSWITAVCLFFVVRYLKKKAE